MKALITGATGFIGTRLCAELRKRGESVAVISRDPERARQALGESITAFAWEDRDSWQRAVAAADAVFHLAGASVAGERWTQEYKQTILQSRVATTRALVDAGPRLLLSSSATGYYGDRGDEVLTETALPGTDFLAQVCVAWEAEALRAAEVTPGARVVCLRTATTLGEQGGALEVMLHPPMVPFSPWKLGLGGPLGSGNQWMPWIHLADLVSLYLWCADNDPVSGPINAVSPKPVRNRDFSHALGHALDRPSLVPVPSFALNALLGEFADSLLSSQRVIPERAQAAGFTFAYPEIGPALLDIFRQE